MVVAVSWPTESSTAHPLSESRSLRQAIVWSESLFANTARRFEHELRHAQHFVHVTVEVTGRWFGCIERSEPSA